MWFYLHTKLRPDCHNQILAQPQPQPVSKCDLKADSFTNLTLSPPQTSPLQSFPKSIANPQ